MTEPMPASDMAEPTLDFPLTNRGFIELFGWISVYFATLDFLVTQTILRLVLRAKLDKSNALTDRTTLKAKFRLLEDLQPDQVTDTAVLGEIQGLLPEALEVAELRNRFIHDQWVFEDKLITAGRIRRIQFVGLDQWETNTLDQEHHFRELAQTLNRIGELQKRFGDILHRLPDIIRVRCPKCNAALETVNPGLGGEVACSHCGHRLPLVASSGNSGR